jgi:ribosomal protein S18 acetylase RimI-like enzyme
VTPRYCIDTAGPEEIARHLVACDATFQPRLSDRVDLADYARKLAQNATRFEAWSDGRLIGLVAVYCNAADRGTAFVSNVSVDPGHTRQGIARLLMQSCIGHVCGLAFKRLSLEVDPAAVAAVRLYHALGFVPQIGQPAAPQRMCLDLDLSLPGNDLR